MMKTLVTLFAATMIMASCSNGASTSTSATSADSTTKVDSVKAAMTSTVTATDSSMAKAPVKDTVKKSK